MLNSIAAAVVIIISKFNLFKLKMHHVISISSPYRLHHHRVSHENLLCFPRFFVFFFFVLQNKEPSQSHYSNTPNASMNPHYMDDLNGSDYVCMTRSAPQAVSKLAALNPVPLASNLNANVVKSAPTPPSDSVSMKLTSKNLQTLQHEHLNSSDSTYSANDNDRPSSVASSQLSNNSSTKRM